MVVVEALPLTVNGKLDVRALPAPEYGQADRYRAPSGLVEEILADSFAQVLGVERVGAEDSFFDLGGDSILAMRVIAGINTALDTDLPVRILLEAPTVASLSQRLGSADRFEEVVPIEVLQQGDGVPLFCLPPGGGLAWPYRNLAPYVDCPIIGIQQVPQNNESGPGSIREMARTYADTIQRLHPDGPYNLIGWSFGGLVAHELAIELRRRACVVNRLIVLDAHVDIKAPDGDFMATESDVLEVLLRAAGIDPEHSLPLSYRRAEELLRQHEATEFPLPSKQMVKILVENSNANVLLSSQHVPGEFDGDMTIFSVRRVDSSALMANWRPHVAGDITEYVVDCEHDEMLNPESLKLYGARLGAHLR
ncbi:thioesterase domain-containing protein [Mycobacterium simulans]|uniref:thioesterase domain-containing protein n=1 Tax=Mycobacterium simulans TaxID=627089 RepID=UPI001CD2B27E|nr:thioesterase domain-containing protein [Mycobacterium simulans]